MPTYCHRCCTYFGEVSNQKAEVSLFFLHIPFLFNELFPHRYDGIFETASKSFAAINKITAVNISISLIIILHESFLFISISLQIRYNM